MTLRVFLLLAIALAIAPTASAADFVSLIKSDDPTQFELVQVAPDTISIKDGELRLTGKSTGYFATKDSYKNFTLKYDFKYDRPAGLTDDDAFTGNSGLLVNILAPHKVWPKCIEFQLMNREVGKIYEVSGGKLSGKWDGDAYKKAIKPVGQWNTMEVTSKDGTMTCSLNGVEVTKGTGAIPDRGPIGWQSEGAPIRFRNMMIKTAD
jgi:hypothetical protein